LLKRNVGPGPTTVGQYNTRTDYVKKNFYSKLPSFSLPRQRGRSMCKFYWNC